MSPWLSELFLSSQSDERLVALARAGHDRAFVTIVERYQRQLNAFARRLVSDGGEEDVVQQALLNAYAALRAGAEVRHLRGWLFRILRNTATKASMSSPPAAQLDPALSSRGALEDEVQQRIFVRDALSEIARLPARQRDAFVETATRGRGRAEVASSMALSEGAVRQLVHRARATLRTAARAILPFPFARWAAGATHESGVDQLSETTIGAGTVGPGGRAREHGELRD